MKFLEYSSAIRLQAQNNCYRSVKKKHGECNFREFIFNCKMTQRKSADFYAKRSVFCFHSMTSLCASLCQHPNRSGPPNHMMKWKKIISSNSTRTTYTVSLDAIRKRNACEWNDLNGIFVQSTTPLIGTTMFLMRSD